MADEDSHPHRRFLHRSRVNRGKKGGKNGEKGDSFQPRNMLGRYSIRSSALQALNHKHELAIGTESEMWLEIHELVESQTGYLATFDLGVVSGVMLIAGSRKVLRDVVDEMEDDDDSEDEPSAEDAAAQEDIADDGSDTEENSEAGEAEIDAFEKPPELERPTHAFEKNTFRMPKWFAQWRGEIKGINADHDTVQDGKERMGNGIDPRTDRDNKAHFQFSSAACRDFDATFSCPVLELKDVAVQGSKITNKASTTSRTWSDYDV